MASLAWKLCQLSCNQADYAPQGWSLACGADAGISPSPPSPPLPPPPPPARPRKDECCQVGTVYDTTTVDYNGEPLCTPTTPCLRAFPDDPTQNYVSRPDPRTPG